MRLEACFVGALLAAPLFSQMPPGADPELRKGEVIWLTLNESTEQVARLLGQPRMVAEFGQDFLSWQFQIGDIDHHDFSHQLVFRRSDRTVVSLTRNYEPERNLDAFFPENESTVHSDPDNKSTPYYLRVRRLPGGRVLMAMGVSKPGQPCGQLVLMRESDLQFFYPWLYRQLNRPAGKR